MQVNGRTSAKLINRFCPAERRPYTDAAPLYQFDFQDFRNKILLSKCHSSINYAKIRTKIQ